MTKKLYISLIITFLSSSVFGQFLGKDDLSVSLFYLQKTELDSAKKYIDIASEDTELKISPKTWFYKGIIYNELYKNKEKDNKISPYRLVALDAFLKMWKMDDNNEYLENGAQKIKYLASTLYNDAARMLTPNDYELSIINFNYYKNAMLLIDPAFDKNAQDIKFKLALASVLNRPAENGDLDSLSSIKVKNIFAEILKIDPNNPSANYNLAINYYNEGVSIISKISYDIDIEEANDIQDRCTKIFLEALPYMKKSYELKYNLKETLIGLSNIYYGLNDMEKSEEYKKELADLEKDE